LRGYFAESGTPWQTAPTDAERGVGADDRAGEIPYTLKIRSGCEGGGKGALVQENMSATLACNNDQYLFQPTAYGISAYESNSMKSSNPHSGIYKADTSRTLDLNGGNPACNQGGIAIVEKMVLDDQGGSQISVRQDGKSPTLRAEMHGNVPCVMESAGFCPEQSAKTRGIGYEEENSPTLRAGVIPAVVSKTWDARGNGDGKTANTITGDHENRITDYTSVVVSKETVALEGNGQRPSHRGDGYLVTDKSYTLNTTEVHGVVYAVDQGGGKSQANVSEEMSPTLTCTHGGEPAVAYPTLTASKASFFMKTDENLASTLVATDYKDPQIVTYGFDPGASRDVGALFIEECGKTLTNGTCPGHHDGVVIAEKPIAIDRAFYNQGKNALYGPQTYEDGTVPTLVAKGPGAVAVRYIVRRLTPTECARLQGFADRWGDIDKKTKFSDEEYHFWHDVRNTHAAINGRAVKEYNKKQMLTWYNKLHTDSAEYKMWGNGIALPTALYVMQGIKEVSNENY
jgi:DNA (cytosine-5)-methyltransferase 1